MNQSVQVSFTIDPATLQRVDRIAIEAHESRSAILRRALLAGLDLAAVHHTMNIPRVAVITEIMLAGLEVLLERQAPDDRALALKTAEERFLKYHGQATADA